MEYLNWSSEDHIAIITLNRSPVNALSQGMIKELSIVLDEIEILERIRVIVIHGHGRFFSAGADIKEFTNVGNETNFSQLGKAGQELFERMEGFSKPIIASIHGAALGGGLELAMGCHIRLVSENAKLGLPELSLGLIPGFGGTQRLAKFVGAARAAEMMFTSEPITGLEAVQYGLANHAYPENKVYENAIAMAKKIAKKSPLTLKAAIELIHYTKTKEFYEGINKEAELFGKVFMSKDGKEGIQAFIEKREPQFRGI